MTEKEFLQQVWRPYDVVVIDDNLRGSVMNVCFSSRSVKLTINGTQDWFRCESISEHITKCGNTDDASIIEDLHNKLMSANKRNEDLQGIVNVQNTRIKELETVAKSKQLEEVRKVLCRIENEIRPTKKLIEYVDSLGPAIDKLETKEEI